MQFFQKYCGPQQTIKKIVESKELGKINFLRYRNCHSGSSANWLPKHFYNKPECGGGAMIDLGAHGMYLIDWLLGIPDTFTSIFTLACENQETLIKNSDKVEDNAVTLMGYENGCIAINETGFVSFKSPLFLEVSGENGYVRMEGENVFKCTSSTNGKVVKVSLEKGLPSPIIQFLTDNIQPGCSIQDAKRLTCMMEKAYKNIV